VAPEKKLIAVWALGHRQDIYENFSEKIVAKEELLSILACKKYPSHTLEWKK
jgi:hypothetical protein